MANRISSTRIIRSIAAVLAGVVTNIVPAVATDLALRFLGIFPPLTEPDAFSTTQLLFATTYRALYGIAGGYVTARLVADHPVGHALVLGVLGVIACSAGPVAMWGVGHAWYPVALILLALPCSWVGGILRVAQSSRQAARPASPSV